MTDTGAQRVRYQVIISGELMPGHDLEEALGVLAQVFTATPAQLRGLFDGTSRSVQPALSADQALDLQTRLQRVGVRAHVDRLAGDNLILQLREAPGTPVRPTRPDTSVARAAGSVPATPPPAASPTAPAAATRPARPSPTGPGHAEQRWRDAWADSHVEDEPDENERIGAFVGPHADSYLKRFTRVRRNNRPTMAPSWNWGAVFSPFLWALYRKLWFWAAIIGMTEIVVPLLFLILAKHGVLPAGFAQIAYMSIIANRVFWPAIADYLYFRHTHFRLLRLFRLQPGYASDLDVANAGGVNTAAVLVGMAFSGVFALFVWSLAGSVTNNGADPFEQRVSALSRQRDLTTVNTPGQVVDDAERSEREETRWSSTRRKLRELGQIVTAWTMRQPAGKRPSELNLYRLREDMDVPSESLRDGWGNEFQYLPDNEGYRLISSGPDQLFGTADDIMYQQVLSR